MAAATVQVSIFTGASLTTPGASAEANLKFNREDTLSGTAAIQIPTTTGTAYSWYKNLALEVTSTGTTAITNRAVYRSSACPAGIELYFQSTAGYTQASSANRPVDATSSDVAPPTTGGWTAFTTTPQNYHVASVGTSSGRNGEFCKLVLGVGSTLTYTGGPGSTVSLPNITVQYDEA